MQPIIALTALHGEKPRTESLEAGCTSVGINAEDASRADLEFLKDFGIAGKEAGGYASFADAQREMVSVKLHQYIPKADNKSVYDKLYVLYRQVHDAFGGVTRAADLSGVMKELITIKEEANV